MSKIVDVEPIIQQVQRNLIPGVDEYGMVSTECAERYFVNLLNNAPMADTVRHSKWTGFPNNGVWSIKCASCHRLIPFGNTPNELPYCPYCGSKMDGE
jgi:hypothetical protein